METESFNIFLGERLRDKNVSLEKLAELSGISVKHLENLLKGDSDKLPPAPYLHGYFVKLGDILGFDGEGAWKEWGKHTEAKSSGGSDRLPKNRFAKKSIVKYVWLSLGGLIVLAYLIVQFSRILGVPELYIANPKADMSNSASEKTTVNGTLQNAKELLINGENIPIDQNGSWQKEVLLEPGLNTLQITAKKFLGRETTVVRQIVYTPPVIATTSATSTTTTR